MIKIKFKDILKIDDVFIILILGLNQAKKKRILTKSLLKTLF